MNESLIPNARAYAARRELQIADSLGSGKDGIVLVAKSSTRPARVAIKAHRLAEPYLREKQVFFFRVDGTGSNFRAMIPPWQKAPFAPFRFPDFRVSAFSPSA